MVPLEGVGKVVGPALRVNYAIDEWRYDEHQADATCQTEKLFVLGTWRDLAGLLILEPKRPPGAS